MPPRDIVDAFSDKGNFSNWMERHDFQSFIPSTFRSFDEAKQNLPVVVKYNQGQGGKGIYLCHNDDELTMAVQFEGSQPYIMQEMINSRFEIVQDFIAFRGKLISVRTTIISMANESFITTYEGDISQSYAVDDVEVNAIAPITTLLHRIVVESGYSGIGNIQYKLGPGVNTIDAIESKIVQLKKYSLHEEATFRSDFSQLLDALDTTTMDSVPKVIEINPRSSGPIRERSNAHHIEFMLQAYIAELTDDD